MNEYGDRQSESNMRLIPDSIYFFIIKSFYYIFNHLNKDLHIFTQYHFKNGYTVKRIYIFLGCFFYPLLFRRMPAGSPFLHFN